MLKPFPPKDPDDVRRYYWDFTAWLARNGGTISSYVIAIDEAPDAGLILGDTAQGTGSYAAWFMAWLSGGTEDITYTARCRLSLTDGTVRDESRTIRIARR